MQQAGRREQKALGKKVHLALDELRMQMMGAQVLFGFAFESAFQERFPALSGAAKATAAGSLGLLVVTIALLLAAPAQLRLVERGQTTRRIHAVATRFAEWALLPFALALGCAFYVAATFAGGAPLIAGPGASVTALLGWYALGIAVRGAHDEEKEIMPRPQFTTPLHVRIDQMLTEARVILPGAQAVLGFQFIVSLSRGFETLPPSLKLLHLAALCANALAVILLIAPAAVHRLAFFGGDDERFFVIGSTLVTVALVPLSLAVASDLYVAVFKMLSSSVAALVASISGALFLLGLWYGLPMAIRLRSTGERRSRPAP